MKYQIVRKVRPRLYRTPDDPEYAFNEPEDHARRRILANVVTSCEEFLGHTPPPDVPQLVNSPYPHHNLYLCFYNAMMAQSMIEQFSFGYLLTRDHRYASQAVRWIEALLNWDFTINTFYSSARIMHALAVAEDWLADQLTDGDLAQIHHYNESLCRHHEDEIDALRSTMSVGGHPTLYTTHFGIAALSLLDTVPDAEKWLDWAIEKCEGALLPHGVADDGTLPHDGNWALSYTEYSKFLFLDALKNVTGIDLYAKYHECVTRPLQFIRYAYVGGSRVKPKRVYGPDENFLTGSWQLDTFSPGILKLAALAQDSYAQWIGTRDLNLGKIQRTEFRVKGGAELLFAWGPFAYLWYDPNLKATAQPDAPSSRSFPATDYVVMRSGWHEPALIVGYQGRGRSLVSHDPSSFTVHWRGRPLIRRVPAPNTVPLPEGNAPALGGEMELIGNIDRFESTANHDYLRVSGFLTTQEFGLTKGETPVLLARFSVRGRKSTEASILHCGSESFLRLGETGYLQYPREGHLSPEGGIIYLRFRLHTPPSDPARTRVIVGVGQGIKSGAGNSFHLGFLDNGALAFRVRDHQGGQLEVTTAHNFRTIARGEWHHLCAWWKGFNASDGSPLVGLQLNDDQAISTLDESRTFTTQPNTSIWLGSSVQTPGTGLCVDVQRFEIFGPDSFVNDSPSFPRADNPADPLLFADYRRSLDAYSGGEKVRECAEGKLELRLHPYRHVPVNKVETKHARLVNDDACLDLYAVPEGSAQFSLQEVPYAQSGLASGSFVKKEERFHRLVVRPTDTDAKRLCILMAPSDASITPEFIEATLKLFPSYDPE